MSMKKRETEGKGQDHSAGIQKEVRQKSLLRYGLLVLGCVFAAVGILQKDYVIVLQKAVRICLECIGIG